MHRIFINSSIVEFYCRAKKRVTVRKFRGKTLVDIREYYDSNGELKPGRKGISLTLEQYEKLKKSIAAIDQAIDDME